MIIRSLSRKTASFRQLYGYINRDQTIPYSILWNLNTHNPYHKEKILEQFYDNADLLKKGKRRNFLYHEIISIKAQSDVSLDYQMQALRDIALKYIQSRGNNLLAYGRMHLEGKNLHIHIMLSANEIDQTKRHYLSKASFDQVQRQCERYMRQKYPELRQPVIFDKDRPEKPNKSRQREYEYTKRTGNKTKKQVTKELLEDLLARERTTSLEKLLSENGFELYQRGKHYGVVFEGTKYRLGTLGLKEEFIASLSRTTKEKTPVPEQEYEEQPDLDFEESEHSNMDRIYQEMKQQEQAMDELEKEIRDMMEEHFPEQDFVVYRNGKTIHIEACVMQYSTLFTLDDIEQWQAGESYFLDQKMQPTLQKLDDLFWQLELQKSRQQKEAPHKERTQPNHPELEL